MGRVEDFEGDSVTCDNSRCTKHERVPSGQIPKGWFRGTLIGSSGQFYDACGGNCAFHINKHLVTDPKLDYAMTWWSATGASAESTVGPTQISMKRKP
jgi:hypothetical protein